MKIRLVRLFVILAVVAASFTWFARQPHAQEIKTMTDPSPLDPAAQDAAPQLKIVKPDSEWKALLTPAQYTVARKKGTERAGSSPLLNEHRHGVFRCVACGLPVFASDAKFESGTGWPSFNKPLNPASITISKDRSFFVERDEVSCARCGAHLGHVFDDGPPPTGLRYCLNGVVLKFEERP